VVLERLISIREAIRHPLWMLVIGAVVAAVSVVISFFIFQRSIGLFTSFLITFAMTPFMVNLITFEEAREEQLLKKGTKLNFLQRHRQILLVYSAFFVGVILSLSFTYLLLPETTVEKIFEDQLNEIKLIRGSLLVPDIFERILINNIGVLLISFFFSFLFGAGAIFILSWNASILATAIGLTAKSAGGITGLPIAVLTFFPHGSLEILAYFIGGIAGGLVSASIVKRKSTMFLTMLKDGLLLLAVAAGMLVVAAFIEVTAVALL
jgi:uncharacterized membrane protein SpoIIM required for sporulation